MDYISYNQFGYNPETWDDSQRKRVQLKIYTHNIIRQDIKEFCRTHDWTQEDLLIQGALRLMSWWNYEESIKNIFDKRVNKFFESFNLKTKELVESLESVDQSIEQIQQAAVDEFLLEIESRRVRAYGAIIKYACLNPGITIKEVTHNVQRIEGLPTVSIHETIQRVINDHILHLEDGKLFPT